MPRLLWCNLDPAWPFARMLHDHCLDWIGHADLWVWDAREPPALPEPPWDDWPWIIAPDALADALDELPPARVRGRILAIQLPAAVGDPGPLGTVLAALTGLVRDHPDWDLYLGLPAGADPAPVRDACPGARLILRLSEDERERVRVWRLLLETALDPQLGPDLAPRAGPVVLDCTLVADRRFPLHDRPAVQWQAVLRGVLGQIGALEHPAVAPVPVIGPMIEPALSDLAVLREGGTIPPGVLGAGPDGPASATPALAIGAPLFHDPGFADRLRGRRDDFLKDTDRRLAARWAALDAWRLPFNAHCRQEDQSLAARLDRLTPIDVGFSEQGRRMLDDWLQRLGLEREREAAAGEALAYKIARDVRTPGLDKGEGYVRHRFAEDDAFDEAVTAALRRGEDLVRLARLVRGWLLVTLLAAVPLLAMRLPGWQYGGSGTTTGWLSPGVRAYVGEPALWLFDLAWLLLPGMLLWAGGLAAAWRRRRALRVALEEVRRRGHALWQRHGEVLDNMALYVAHTAIMRRLTLLGMGLGRLAGAVGADRQALAAIRGTLERQQRDYQVLQVPPPTEPIPTPPVLAELLRKPGATPLTWLRALVPPLPAGARRMVSIEDTRLANTGRLTTGYLWTDAVLRLRGGEAEPP